MDSLDPVENVGILIVGVHEGHVVQVVEIFLSELGKGGLCIVFAFSDQHHDTRLRVGKRGSSHRTKNQAQQGGYS